VLNFERVFSAIIFHNECQIRHLNKLLSIQLFDVLVGIYMFVKSDIRKRLNFIKIFNIPSNHNCISQLLVISIHMKVCFIANFCTTNPI
jgi:hypothetical protein